ncbi:hypothetical protein OHA72_29825 [Dactylosporangium sp. NBC_01737]|uniref:hypothetical protein n=1 Tax=Dactylosporangium sp. NBC_01737 TaxID=2975959 RepID=UPI002E1222F8|nr:hypothetical protein OHA72_29825 [Dactylosporangium sp. NBC_01737]
MSTRVVFFDPAHGIGLRIAAGSGRSWQDQPGGDPVHAHCTLDIPADTLLPAPDERERPSSGTLFVPWAGLAAFAGDLEDLRPGLVARLGDVGASLAVRMRRDGHLRAEAVFTVGHHVTTTVRCRTLWDWHHGTAADLPALARSIRAARG